MEGRGARLLEVRRKRPAPLSQPRSQEPERARGSRTSAAGNAREGHSGKGAANRRDHPGDQGRPGRVADVKSAWSPVALSELLTQREPDVAVVPTETYSFAGVYSFGRGVFRAQQKTGGEFSYRRLSRIRAGDFVYP